MLEAVAAGDTFPIPGDGRVHAANLGTAPTVDTALRIHGDPEKRLSVTAAVGGTQRAEPTAEGAIGQGHQYEKDGEKGEFPDGDGTGGGSQGFIGQEERYRSFQGADRTDELAEGGDADAGHAPKEERQEENEEQAPDVFELTEALCQG